MNNCLWTNLMVILLYHNLERILFGAVDCGHQQESNTRNIWKSVCTNCVTICLLNWYEKTLIIWEKSQFAAWEITKMCAQHRYKCRLMFLSSIWGRMLLKRQICPRSHASMRGHSPLSLLKFFGVQKTLSYISSVTFFFFFMQEQIWYL